MPKFSNTKTRKATPTSPVQIVGPALTHEGAPAFERDAKSELFMLAVSNFVSEDTFYEKAEERDNRFVDLVHAVTLQDADWVARFIPWLRNEANMRSAPIVMAAESVAIRLAEPDKIAAQLPSSTVRQVVNSAMSRADEPAEFAAYWTKRFGKKTFPGGVQRGLQDAVNRLYNERAALKYDGGSRGFRMGDVLELAHAPKKADWQGDLFEYLLDRRHHADNVFISDRVDKTFGRLPMIAAYRHLHSIDVAHRRAMLADPLFPGMLKNAGMTWEDLSGWLQGPMDAAAWEAVIPSMGYMALLRNLRNFDEQDVSKQVAAQVIAKLIDPNEVARSRQLPFRFLSAYIHSPNDRWKQPLGDALDLATQNIPELGGSSLILIDTSASMSSMGYSGKSSVTPAMQAALFAIALAKKQGGQVAVFGFADGTFRHDLQLGASTLNEVERFLNRIGEVGHGTNIPAAYRCYAGEDRVFLFSDMQTMAHYGDAEARTIPENIPVYGFNLGGYDNTVMDTRVSNRHEMGGLTDRTFSMVKNLEIGKSAIWPF